MQIKLVALGLLLFLGSFVRAQTPVIDSLKKIIAQDRQDSVEAYALIKLADEFSRTNMVEAKRCSGNAMAIAIRLNLSLLCSAAYSQLTTMNAQTNQPDSAARYLGLLKQLSENTGLPTVKENYNSTAGLFYRFQGNYKAALPYLLEVLRLSTKRDNKIGMAGQSLNIGNTYLDLGEYENAMSFHLKALSLFETLGNKRGLSFCYNGIGTDFTKLGRYADALPYIRRSLALKTELNDKKGIASAYTNMGVIEDGLKEYDKAVTSYKQALVFNKELSLIMDQAKDGLSIGKTYVKARQPDSAREYFLMSRILFRQLNDTNSLVAVNAEIADLQNNLSRQRETEKSFMNTLTNSIEMGDKSAEVDNYKYLSDFYARNGQFDKALLYNEKLHRVTDSLESRDVELKMTGLERQFNLEKKEKEISLLKKDRLLYEVNAQKQQIFRYGVLIFFVLLVVIGFLVMTRYRAVQKTRRLLEIEKIRNHLARNLHDDIGSTLSSINILSKCALQQAGDNTRVASDLEKIRTRSSTLMESMGDIVWAINPENDPLDRTLLKMKEFAAEILEPAGIGFTFKEDPRLSDLQLGVEARKNVYLIFKEALNNAVKYSGATQVDINLDRPPGQFLMKILDNGKGFDPGIRHPGNGLKNMQSRARDMQSVLEVHSSPAMGTMVRLALPIT